MSEFDCVGIDVAKDKLDVSIEVEGRWKHKVFANEPEGHLALISWLSEYSSCPWVCMEATGHYSEVVADFLVAQGIRVSVANPQQVHSFAKASLTRNKNDLVDSRVIQQYCKRMQPRVFQSSSVEQKEVRELTKLLDMLKSQLTQLQNQLHSIRATIAKKALIKRIQSLEKDIAEVEQQIADLIANHKQLKEKIDLMTSIKGIGKLTAYRLIALMPDLSNFASPKQFAAFIGITPKQRQSGTFAGKTTISKLGNPRLRKSLYMAALVAKKYNKAFTDFVARLKLKGKSPKTIICAIMRKLAHIIFAVLKNNRPFDPNFACL